MVVVVQIGVGRQQLSEEPGRAQVARQLVEQGTRRGAVRALATREVAFDTQRTPTDDEFVQVDRQAASVQAWAAAARRSVRVRPRRAGGSNAGLAQ